MTKPPYEITETGWGEFEIIIKIFFIDPNERSVSILSVTLPVGSASVVIISRLVHIISYLFMLLYLYHLNKKGVAKQHA